MMYFAGRGAGRHQRLARVHILRTRRHTLTVPRQPFSMRRARLPVRLAVLVGMIRPR